MSERPTSTGLLQRPIVKRGPAIKRFLPLCLLGLLVLCVCAAPVLGQDEPRTPEGQAGYEAGQACAANVIALVQLFFWPIAVVYGLVLLRRYMRGQDKKRREEAERKSTRLCPYCMELVQLQAIKCKHCGSDVTPKDSSDTE